MATWWAFQIHTHRFHSYFQTGQQRNIIGIIMLMLASWLGFFR